MGGVRVGHDFFSAAVNHFETSKDSAVGCPMIRILSYLI